MAGLQVPGYVRLSRLGIVRLVPLVVVRIVLGLAVARMVGLRRGRRVARLVICVVVRNQRLIERLGGMGGPFGSPAGGLVGVGNAVPPPSCACVLPFRRSLRAGPLPRRSLST